MSIWTAPVADGHIRATVDLPGSKSITNRALVLAALADGPSTVTGALRSRDTNPVSYTHLTLPTIYSV